MIGFPFWESGFTKKKARKYVDKDDFLILFFSRL